MLKYIEKIIPRRCSLPLIICGVCNCIAYYGGMLFAGVFPMHNWTLSIDNWFSLSPLWCIMYVASFIYWVVNYILISRDHPEMVYRLVAADMAAKFVCLVFFVFLPTTLDQPSLDGYGWQAFLLRIIYALDQPVNLFPSIHCLVAWFCFRPLLDCKNVKPWYKVLSLCLTLLVFLSTLYTKQHVFVDVLGGWALAELSYDLAPKLPIIKWLKRWNRKFDNKIETV